MGTIATNLLPNATGLDLGSPSQRFDIFAKDLTADALTSNSANPATTGEINLASTDAIAWRNAANSADVLLSKSQGAGALPADTLQWPNGVSAPEFITSTVNPSTTGLVRLAKTDTINFRNNANSGDLIGLDLNTDDTLSVGDVLGIRTGSIAATGDITTIGGVFASSPGNPVILTATGAAGDSVNLIAGGTTGIAGGNINLNAGNAVGANGGTVTITGGNSTTSAVGGAIVLVPGTGASGQAACVLNGTTTITNKITHYNGVTTAGQGIPLVVASLTSSAQNAAIVTATLFTTATAGLYRLNYSLTVDTAGNAVNLTGTWGWTDSAAHTLTTANIACNTLGANSTSALGLGQITFSAFASTNITYATALSGAIGVGFYTLRLILEQLG